MNTKNKINNLEIKLSKVLNWWLFGSYKSKFSGAWMEFDEHREYNFWDNVKDIDWKASARWNKLQIKQYELEKDLSILFVLNNSTSMQFWSRNKTKKETLEEVFYSIAVSANMNNDNVWAIVYDEKNLEFIEHKKSKNNIYKILEKMEPHLTSPLEERNNSKSSPLPQGRGAGGEVLDNLLKRKIKNNLIFILSDDLSEFDEKKLKILNEQNEIIIINIFDEIENKWPHPNPLLIGEGISWNITINSWKSFLNIDLNKNKLQEFKNLREKEIDETKYKLEKSAISYIYIDNNSDILKELVKFFNKR